MQEVGEGEWAASGRHGVLVEQETRCGRKEEEQQTPRISWCLSDLSFKVIKARKSKKEPVGLDLKVEFDAMDYPPDQFNQFMGFNSDIKTEDFY